MIERVIPSSGERLPAVGLGTWQTFDLAPNTLHESDELVEVLSSLVAAGGTVVDSSPMYGTAESNVGELAERAGIASRLFVATKVWTRGETEGIHQMEQSIRRLHRNALDLMQIHNLVDWRTHLRTLRRWKDEGRVRYIGVTHYTASAYDELESIIERESVDFAQFAYSAGYRAAERSLLQRCADRGVAVLVNRPFEEGSALRGLRSRALPPEVAEYASTWSEAMLKWILAHPAVTCVIPATRSADHMRENIAAGAGRLPTPAEREAFARLIG